MCAMPSFMRECGNSTKGISARCALRMRVSMSEMGSVGVILPACLGYARDQAVERHFAKGQARDAELAEMPAAAAGDTATVHQARWAGVARQFCEGLIIALGFQFGAHRGVFLHRGGFAFITFNPGCLCHKSISINASVRPAWLQPFWLRRMACPSLSATRALRRRFRRTSRW